jgi:hypothetical protein
MTLSMNSGLKAAFSRSGSKPAALFTLNVWDGAATQTYKFLWATQALTISGVKVPPLVGNPSITGQSVNHITRQSTISAVGFSLPDVPYIRNILTNNIVSGQKLLVTIGDESIDPANWLDCWSCRVVDYNLNGAGGFDITSEGLSNMPRGIKVSGIFANLSPSELAYKILRQAKVPDSVINTGSFDFDADTTKSHFIMKKIDSSYFGGQSRSVTATGAIASANVESWQLKDVSAKALDNNGRLYAYINVVAGIVQVIDVELYNDYSGGLLVGVASVRQTSGPTSKEVIISPPRTSDGSRLEYGISGSVFLSGLGSSYEIGLASTSYLTVDTAQYGEEIDAYDAISEIAGVVNSSILEREDGTLEWKGLDLDASAARVLDDITGIGDINQGSAAQDIINQAIMEWECADLKVRDATRTPNSLSQQDADSLESHSIDGGTTDGIREKTFKSQWLNSIGLLSSTISNSDTTVVNFTTAGKGEYLANYGCCGTGGVTAGPTQSDATRKAASGSDRYIYLRLNDEIIRVGTSAITDLGKTISFVDPETDLTVSPFTNYEITYTSCDRGYAGSTAVRHPQGTEIYDITIPYVFLQETIRRYNNGIQIVNVSTSLKHADLQVLDVVSLDTDFILAYGLDGVDSLTTWEIIDKQIELDTGRVNFKLAKLTSKAAQTNMFFRDLQSPLELLYGNKFPGPFEQNFFPSGSALFTNGNGVNAYNDGYVFDYTNIRLGIGTATPGSKLSLYDATTADLSIDSGGTYTGELIADSSGVTLKSTSNHKLLFGTNDSAHSAFDTAGKFGVGTTSPDEVGDFRGNLQLYATRATLLLGDSGQTSKARLQSISGLPFLGNNTYYDGSDWQRDDTSIGSAVMNINRNAPVDLRYVASGSGTITWSRLMYGTNAGKLGIGNNTSIDQLLHLYADDCAMKVENSSNSKTGYVQMAGETMVMTNNAYYDGSDWQRDVTGDGSSYIRTSDNSPLYARYTAAGSGVISWTTLLYGNNSGDVAIGDTTSPQARLHVRESAVSSASYASEAALIVEKSGANASVQLMFEDGYVGSYKFGTDNGATIGEIKHDSSDLILANSGTDGFKIDSQGASCFKDVAGSASGESGWFKIVGCDGSKPNGELYLFDGTTAFTITSA